MKISIIVSTYNGEKYIKEQLESIMMQTRRPDEVLISDDNSSDNTVSIIRQFISDNNLDKTWRISVNNPGKGCTKNFIEGAFAASGDILFFCDQDDIWKGTKLESMEQGFVEHRDMLACYCLETYVDESGRIINSPMKFTHNVKTKDKGFTKVSFEDNVKYNKCPGLCLAFKKDVLNVVGPMILKYQLMHDLPIGNYAALHNGLYVLNKELVNYRQHSNNLSAPKITISSRVKNISYQIKGRRGRLKQLSAFYDTFSEQMNEKDRTNLQNAIIETKNSISYLESRNSVKLFGQLFLTNPMMNRWILLNNLLCSLFGKI